MARTIALNLLFRTQGTEKLKQAEQEIGTFRKGLGSLGGAIAGFAGGAVIAQFAKESIKAASDLSESVSKAKVVFGESSKEVLKFAENSATAFGQSRQQAVEAAGTFGNLFVSMKLGQKESAGMATSLVKLASDLASFNNTDPTEALDALRAGLVGETEPLRRFGINLNDATLKAEAMALGLEYVGDTMPPAIKAQAAYSMILKQSTTAQGDFARTSQGLANQQRIANAQFEDAKATLGEKLLPIAIKFTQFLNASVIPAISKSVEWIEKNSNALILLGKVVGAGVAIWLTYQAAIKAAAAAHAIFAVGSKVISAVSSAWETLRLRMMLASDAIQSAGGPIKALNRQVGGLAGIGTKLRGAIGGMAGALGGPWGLAVTGAIAALTIFATRNDESAARVDELTDALKENKGALDSQSISTIKNSLETSGAYQSAQKLGISLRDVTDAALGNKPAMDRVTAALDKFEAEQRAVSIGGEGAELQLHALTNESRNLRSAVQGSNSEITEAREKYSRLTAASGGVIESQAGVKDGFYKIAEQASKAEDEIKDVVSALGLFNDKALDSRMAALDFRDAVSEFTSKLKTNGLQIDKNTGFFNTNKKAGRDNERMVIDLIKKLGALAQKEYEASGSTSKATSVFNKNRDMLLRTAAAMGISRKDLQRLIDKYLDTRSQINKATGDLKNKTVRIKVQADGTVNLPGGQKASIFAKGGIMPGYTPGRDVHQFVSPTGGRLALSGGEAVMRPEFTKAVGPSFINALNAAARSGGVKGVQKMMAKSGVPGEGAFFAGGGIISKHSVEGVGNITRGLGKYNDHLANWTWKTAQKVVKKLNSLGVGGPKVQAALRWAKAQAGKPYQWAGVGPGAYDCSGFMGSIAAKIQGKNPHARYFSTHSFGAHGPMGFRRNLKSGFTVGVTDAGVGHMAGTLGGKNVESSGSAGVRVGGGARGTGSGLFTRRYGLKMSRGGMIPFSGSFDRGGVIPRGFSAVYNGTGGAETLRPMTSTGTGSGGGDLIINEAHFHGVQDVASMVKQIQKYAKDSGGIVLKIRN